MACRSTLQMINSITKFVGTDYVEWCRSFNNILQISWLFLIKIVSGLENTIEEDTIEGSDDETLQS